MNELCCVMCVYLFMVMHRDVALAMLTYMH